MTKMTAQGEIANLRIFADTDFLPAVTALVREVGEGIGLDKSIYGKLELLVEEAVLNVINYSFEPGQGGVFELSIKRLPGKIVAEVADKGQPVDYSKIEADTENALGILLLKKLADEVHFVNRGKEGKAIEIALNLPYDMPETLEAETHIDENAQIAPPEEELEYLRATRRDTSGITRSIYRTYGYSYTSDTLYFPEKIAELISEGYLHSAIALNPHGEVVGHASLRLDFPGASVGEFGQLVVDPRYRGRGIAKKLNEVLVETAQKRGMFGYYAHAVTTHPFSQKTILSNSAVETAYLPSFVPASLVAKSISVEQSSDRHAEIAYFRRIGENRKPRIYPPIQHTSMVEKIFMLNFMDFETAPADAKCIEALSENTEMSLRVFEGPKRSFLTIDKYGADFDSMLAYQLRQLCLKKIEAISLQLPIDSPWTRKKCAYAEKLGFFFCGIMPGMGKTGNDLLRLMYLNNVDISLDNPVIVTDFGKELANYVLAGYKG